MTHLHSLKAIGIFTLLVTFSALVASNKLAWTQDSKPQAAADTEKVADKPANATQADKKQAAFEVEKKIAEALKGKTDKPIPERSIFRNPKEGDSTLQADKILIHKSNGEVIELKDRIPQFSSAPSIPRKANTTKRTVPHSKFYLLNRDGSDLRELVSLPDYYALGSPKYSADGKQILFVARPKPVAKGKK